MSCASAPTPHGLYATSSYPFFQGLDILQFDAAGKSGQSDVARVPFYEQLVDKLVHGGELPTHGGATTQFAEVLQQRLQVFVHVL